VRSAERNAVALEEAAELADESAGSDSTDRRLDLQRILAIVHSLRTTDRQVMLLYLEDLEAAAIAEVTGISPGNVATKIHRIKALLSARLNARGRRT
jgi:RNA polymerase sigma-70 factor (ECF subfamily)